MKLISFSSSLLFLLLDCPLTPFTSSTKTSSSSITLVNALSTPVPSSNPDIMPREFIQLNNPIGNSLGVGQSLPASFVRNWPTWVLDMDNKLSKIPDDDGFVPPASIDELWQPIDLKRPELRLALGLHVRSGMIRHVMPAVDLSFNGGCHRNRGMCSVPRAHSWIDFTNSLDEWENYHLKLAMKKMNDEAWKEVPFTSTSSPSSTSSLISSAIERAMVCLADAPDELGDGSHIVNVLLSFPDEEFGVVECPKTGHELRVMMGDDDDVEDENLAPGILQVAITASMAGSESEYLPEVYKELYNDESLRNPMYAKFKTKKSQNGGKK